MDRIVVQVETRAARGPELARSSRDELTIGRAFSSDIILTDPFVAPHQLRLCRIDQSWQLQVVDAGNEVLLNGKPLGSATTPLNSGDRITVGRTDLRVFDEDHALEPTKRIPLSSWLAPGRFSPWTACLLLLGVASIDGIVDYFQYSVDREWDSYAYASLFSVAIVVVWSAVWALVGRVLRHQPHFFAQITACVLVYAGAIAVFPLPGFLEFATSELVVGQIANTGLTFVCLAVLFNFNLLLATNVRRPARAAVVVSAALIGLAYAAYRVTQDDFESQPEYSSVVRPPFAHFTEDQEITAFIQAAKTAEAALASD